MIQLTLIICVIVNIQLLFGLTNDSVYKKSWANKTGVYVSPHVKGFKIDFALPNVTQVPTDTNEQHYIQLLIQNYQNYGEAGQPELPGVSFRLRFPTDSVLSHITIKSLSTRIISLKNHVFPVQPAQSKVSTDTAHHPFYIDSAFYTSRVPTTFAASATSKQTQLIRSLKKFTVGGAYGQTFLLTPFSYNPLTKELTVIDRAEVIIEFEMSEELRNDSPSMKNLYRTLFLNGGPKIDNPSTHTRSSAVSSITTLQRSSQSNYLIITPKKYLDTLKPFIEYKMNNGYRVVYALLEKIGSTKEAIKSYIQQQYSDTFLKPEFVLLVGSVDDIPMWQNPLTDEQPFTDLYYSTLDGNDTVPDVFLGRFPVATNTQLKNIVDKTMYMDNNLSTTGKKVSLVATFDSPHYIDVEAVHNYVGDTLMGPSGFTIQKRYAKTNSSEYNDISTLIGDINDNSRFLIYSGHGSPSAWVDIPVLNQVFVNGGTYKYMTNTISYPFIYSFACQTGDVSEQYNSIATQWLTIENGAVSYLGATQNSYFGYDDTFERMMFDGTFNSGFEQLGPQINAAKIQFYTEVPTMLIGVIKRISSVKYLEQYNLYGDPSLMVVKSHSKDYAFAQYTIDDSRGNATGFANPGDTLSITVALKNIGTQALLSAIGTVTTQNTEVTLLNQHSTFNDVEVDAITQSGSVFEVILPSTLQVYTEINLTLEIREGSGFLDTVEFSIPVYQTSSIYGTVVTEDSGLPVNDITIRYTGPSEGTTLSDVDGEFTFPTIDGVYTVITESPYAYYSSPFTITIPDIDTATIIPLQKPTLSTTLKDTALEITQESELVIPFSITNAGKMPLELEMVISQNRADTRVCNDRDGGGYCWDDSDSNPAIPFEWFDIYSVGKNVHNRDVIVLPFRFQYYGSVYNKIYVNSNGFISFSDGNGFYDDNTGEAFPNTQDTPKNVLAPFFDDLEISNDSASGIFVLLDDQKVIVQFNHMVKKYFIGTLTFQVVLNVDGSVAFNYKDVETVADLQSATIGIQDADGAIGFSVAHNEAYLHDSLSVEIYNPFKLVSSHYDGESITSYQNVLDSLLLAPRDLPVGVYTEEISVYHNDPLQVSPLVYSIETGVTDAVVHTRVSDTHLLNVQVASIQLCTLLLENISNDAIELTTLNFSNTYFSHGQTLPITVAANNTELIPIVFAPEHIGFYSNSITLISKIASNDNEVVRKQLTVIGTTVDNRGLRPDQFSMAFDTLKLGLSSQRTLTLDNLSNFDVTIASASLVGSCFTIPFQSGDIVSAQSTLSSVITFTPSLEGECVDTLIIKGSFPDSLAIPLEGHAINVPNIALSDSSFSTQVASGDEIELPLTVLNTSFKQLSYDVFDILLPDWLTIETTYGLIDAGGSATITIHCSAILLSPGTYTYSLLLYSNADDEFFSIPISFTVF
ncbi:MAG: C25 family cysteine peptidase [Fibrobacterales bacterium]